MASLRRRLARRPRNPWARIKPARRYQDEYVKAMILADLKEIGGRGTLFDLDRLRPGRYDRRYFTATMKSLHPFVRYGGSTRFGFFGRDIWQLYSWKPPEEEKHEGSADGSGPGDTG